MDSKIETTDGAHGDGAVRSMKCSANRSNDYARTQHNPREAAFAAAWEKENEPCNHINYGNGILQDLFCTGSRFGIQGVTATKVLTDDERMVTATAIQWLGTNCGWCFLEEVVNKCGYKLVRVDSPNDGAKRRGGESPAAPDRQKP